jgi:hypothetical protein
VGTLPRTASLGAGYQLHEQGNRRARPRTSPPAYKARRRLASPRGARVAAFWMGVCSCAHPAARRFSGQARAVALWVAGQSPVAGRAPAALLSFAVGVLARAGRERAERGWEVRNRGGRGEKRSQGCLPSPPGSDESPAWACPSPETAQRVLAKTACTSPFLGSILSRP